MADDAVQGKEDEGLAGLCPAPYQGNNSPGPLPADISWQDEQAGFPQLLEETRTSGLVPCASGHGGFQPPNRCAKRTGKRDG